LGTNWARIWLDQPHIPNSRPHEVPPDKALRFIARDDHEMHMTSLVIIVTPMFEYVGHDESEAD
jgi:hypothetical protein